MCMDKWMVNIILVYADPHAAVTKHVLQTSKSRDILRTNFVYQVSRIRNGLRHSGRGGFKMWPEVCMTCVPSAAVQSDYLFYNLRKVIFLSDNHLINRARWFTTHELWSFPLCVFIWRLRARGFPGQEKIYFNQSFFHAINLSRWFDRHESCT